MKRHCVLHASHFTEWKVRPGWKGTGPSSSLLAGAGGLKWSFPRFTFVFLGYWLAITRSFYLVIKGERLSLSTCVCVMSPSFCVHLSLCVLVSSLCRSVPSSLFTTFSLSVPWFFEHVHSFFTFVSQMVCLAPSYSLLLPLGLRLCPFFL